MRVIFFLFLFQLSGDVVFCQVSATARVEPDTLKIRKEVSDLENVRKQLTERINKLRVAIREDSIGILQLKSKRKEVNDQSEDLKKGIAVLEGTSTKTSKQRKLLKDLKKGHSNIAGKLVSMDQELNVIELNYKASVDLLASAQSMVKDLAKQLKELRKLLSP